MKLKPFLFLSAMLVLILYIPYLGGYIAHSGVFPEDYFRFPPQGKPKPGFNQLVFILIAAIFILILLVYIFPRLFGFKKLSRFEFLHREKVKLPLWFWIGLAVWAAALVIQAGKFSEPKWLVNWSFIPLCWGFIMLLDGIVYYINGGRSMLKDSPTELFGMGMVSISGWFIFEYLNFFIRHNWYYPFADHLLAHDSFLVYAVVGSSAFIPMSFEWYQLLRTSKLLDHRFRRGRKVSLPHWLKIVLLVISLAGMFITPFYPDNLFWVVWLAPVVILGLALELTRTWTPFTEISRNGNWSSLMLFALTFFIQGFLLEWWNYLSADHNAAGEVTKTYNAAYWVYCLPYVYKYKIFEMPLLGYAGYFLFSVHCWLWWIVFSKLMNISTQFSLQEDYR